MVNFHLVASCIKNQRASKDKHVLSIVAFFPQRTLHTSLLTRLFLSKTKLVFP